MALMGGLLLVLGTGGGGEKRFHWFCLSEGDLGGSGNSEQVDHALGNAVGHRVYRRVVAGLGGNVDTGIHQVSDVLGLALG